MFETILQKILIQYFGKFISGLDKNNLKLGVWSGNVVIENVNLKPEITQLLEIPIILAKSSVGRLILKVPWKKLTSAPVEIIIENVYITLNQLNEWVFNDQIQLQKKIEGLIKYCQKCIKKGTKQKKEKDKGYLDKVALKILDNIQLKIVNIHIRYEEQYNWGITLEALEIFTTNQQWQRCYIDKSENPNVSVNKLFQLKNLAFYWNVSSQDNKKNYEEFMNERILKQNLEAKEFCNFIVAINAEMRVIQNDFQNTNALYEMKLELEDLNLSIKQKQFQQMSHFFEICSQYSRVLWLQRKQNQVNENEIMEYQKSFAIIFPKIQLFGAQQLEQEEKEMFNKIVRHIDQQILLQWVQIVARQLVKEEKINKATQEKIKKENAWWKSEKKQVTEISLSQEEIISINQQIDQFFLEEKKRILQRPDHALVIQFQLILKKGVFKLENQRDGFELAFSLFQISIETRVDQTILAIFKLSNLSSDLIVQNELYPFFYKQQQSEKIDQFLNFHFQKHSKESDIYASMLLQIEPIQFKYHKEILKQWNEYFNSENQFDNVVQTTVDQSQNQESNQSQQIMDKVLNNQFKVKLFIQIANPSVILNQVLFNFETLSIEGEKESQFNHQNGSILKNDNITFVSFIVQNFNIQIIQSCEYNIPLLLVVVNDLKLQFVKKRKFVMKWSASIYSQCFDLETDYWEPFIEPFDLIGDHSQSQDGNLKQFTSIFINGQEQMPVNINFTKESIKNFVDISKKLEKFFNKQNIKNSRDRRTSSIIQRSSSVIQSDIEKNIVTYPYMIENQTGFSIELTIIVQNNNQKRFTSVIIENQQQHGLQFAGNNEKRTISVKIISKFSNFGQINNITFSKNTDLFRPIHYQMGELQKQVRILIQKQMRQNQKLIILSSEILFFNQCEEIIEVKLVNKTPQNQIDLIIEPQKIYYLPLGFEHSMLQLRQQKNGIWSQMMEVQKLIQKNANYNLFINIPCLILSVQKAMITTMPTQINLLCPFAIKNQLILPVDVYFTLEEFQRIQPNDIVKISNTTLQKGIKFKFKLPGFQKSDFVELNSQFKSQFIIIRDYLGIELELQLNFLPDEGGLVTLAIDGGLTIINSLGMNLFYFSKQSQSFQLQYQPGQPIFQVTEKEDELREKGCLQIINQVQFLCLTFEQCNQEITPTKLSQPINCQNDGSFFSQIPIEEGYMDVLIDISTSQLFEKQNKKIVNINPKYVIVNKLQVNLTISQDRSSQEILIMPDCKLPYYWAKKKSPQLLKFKFKNTFSGIISITQLGSVLLPIRNLQGLLLEYIRVNTQMEDKITYIVVEEAKQQPLYRLINQLNYDIQFYQTEIQDLNQNIKTNLPKNTHVDYCFDNPGLKNEITLELYKDDIFSDFVKVLLINQNSQTEYKMADDEVFYLNNEFSLELQQMVIIFSNEKKNPYQICYDHFSQQFTISIPKIFVSIINSNPREELIVIFIDGFEFIRLQDILDTLQIRIENFQIDNNQQFRCPYPILLSQQNQGSSIPFLSFLLRRAHQINFVNYYESVKLAIQPINLKITEGTYEELEQYFQILRWIDEIDQFQLRIWQQDKKQQQQQYFFQILEIYPIKIKLSFQKIGGKRKHLLKSAASQIINCDEVNILIKGYSIRNCNTSIEQLENKMKLNYMEALDSQIYKLAGSIDFIGNPIGLISNVGDGLQDLIEMPYEGFIQGPLEGGVGIVKGVGSLTKGVVSGTFNSVSKITGSVALGISQLSMDDEYLRTRQNQNSNKPKNIVTGLGQGMVSLFSGVGHGVSGLVTQPYQGAEQGGVKGFLQGVSKGLAGLVVKPVTGALDLVSKTSEGIKNTAHIFDDQIHEKRERIPRAFYGKEQIFKNYVLQHSEIMCILSELRPEQAFVDSYIFFQSKYQFAFVITVDLFILLEMKTKQQILIQFSHDNLKAFESSEKEFRIYLNTPQIIYKERAKVKGFIFYNLKKLYLQVNEQDKESHKFLTMQLERILKKDF